jgi:transposase
MLDKVESAHRGRRIEVWFQDEARFGQQGTITRVWARRGSRPRAVRQTKYEWLYVIGAVCPQTGESVGLLSPIINSEIVNVFLRQFIAEVSQDVHVLLLWDRAGFHMSKKLKIPENVTIVPLPSYSPELNPVENLWHYLRSHYWANKTYADYDALRLAAVDAWQRAALDKEIVKSVCFAEYAQRN